MGTMIRFQPRSISLLTAATTTRSSLLSTVSFGKQLSIVRHRSSHPVIQNCTTYPNVRQVATKAPRSSSSSSLSLLSFQNIDEPSSIIATKEFQGFLVGRSYHSHPIASNKDAIVGRNYPASKAQPIVPRIIQCRTIDQVLQIYSDNRDQMTGLEISHSWNHIGKLVSSNSKERQRGQHKNVHIMLRSLLSDVFRFWPGFHPTAKCGACHRLAKISIACRFDAGIDSWTQMEHLLLASIEDFDARSISNILWSFGKTNRGSPVLYRNFARAAFQRLSQFAPQTLSNTAWSLATTSGQRASSSPQTELFRAIAAATIPRVREFRPQGLANTAWAFARTNHPSAEELFVAIAREATRRGNEFNAQDLANTAWAFATMNHSSSEELFKVVTKEAMPKLGRFNSQVLANIVWSYAKMGIPSPKLFEAVAKEAVPKITTFKAQELANTAWAFAKTDHSAELLFDAIAEESVRKIGDFKTQELVNLVWAFATIGRSSSSEELFRVVARESIPRVQAFNTQQLSNTTLAFAKMNVSAEQLFDAVAKESIQQIDHFSSQGLANVAWAFAKIGRSSSEHDLFDAIAEQCVQKVNDFSAQGLANTAWAFATKGHGSARVFDAIAQESIRKVDTFKPQELSNTMWAFAVVGHSSSSAALAWFDTVAQVSRRRAPEFDAQEFTNTVWAYAALDYVPRSEYLFGKDCKFVAACWNKARGFDTEKYCNVHQFVLWSAGEKRVTCVVPPDLQRTCRDVFLRTTTGASRLQRDVAEVLVSMIGGTVVAVEEEVRLTNSGYSIDILATFDGGVKVAIEVDGPSHFIGPTKTPTGSTRLKRRQIQRVDDITLVSIPHWEWRSVQANDRKDGGSKHQEEYLISRLDAVLPFAYQADADQCNSISYGNTSNFG